MSAAKLRELTEEYLCALDLGRYEQVSRLTPPICSLLVELYEERLEEDRDEVEPSDANEKEEDAERRLVESMCASLRKQAQLASAYAEVIQFVHVQDMICLSQMVGALPEQRQWPPLDDYGRLAGVLRKSIYLLKSINLTDKEAHATAVAAGEWKADDDGEWWLDADRLGWLEGGGGGGCGAFAACVIDRSEAPARPPLEDKEAARQLRLMELISQRAAPRPSAASSAVASELEDGSHHHQQHHQPHHLASDWFAHFWRRSLAKRPPLDRFTLLVAVWLVGHRSGHRQLEQLVGGLVEGLLHERAGSADEEELLQLRQTGAFWLSWHRRRPSWPAELAGSSSLEPPSSTSSSIDGDQEEEAEDDAEEADLELDWRARLQRLIDRELLIGRPCPVCRRPPSGEPLEPLRRATCCLEPRAYCARSHQLIGLLDLRRLPLEPTIKLLMLAPSEWARQAHLASTRSRQERETMEAKEEGGPAMDARLQVSDRFERLTIVKPGGSSGSSSGGSSDGHQDDDGSGDEDGDNNELQAAATSLAAFMRSRQQKQKQQQQPRQSREVHASDEASESARMIAWFAAGHPEGAPTGNSHGGRLLPLNSGDLLLLEELRQGQRGRRLLRARLAATKLASGRPLWVCCQRSKLSGLQLGCGRLLLSHGGGGGDNDRRCAHCGHQLRRALSLAEAQRRRQL